MTSTTVDVIWHSQLHFQHRMDRLADRLAGTGAIIVTAIGSSTTAGEDGIVPCPQRLESALRVRYPGRHFDMLNRGAGGKEAPQELDRLTRDVIVEKPSVVIWQIGTKTCGKRRTSTIRPRRYETGSRSRSWPGAEADIVLMDLQFTPAVLVKDKIDGDREMERLIAEAAAMTRMAGSARRFDKSGRGYTRWFGIVAIALCPSGATSQ